jgi:hypothetical protein
VLLLGLCMQRRCFCTASSVDDCIVSASTMALHAKTMLLHCKQRGRLHSQCFYYGFACKDDAFARYVLRSQCFCYDFACKYDAFALYVAWTIGYSVLLLWLCMQRRCFYDVVVQISSCSAHSLALSGTTSSCSCRTTRRRATALLIGT